VHGVLVDVEPTRSPIAALERAEAGDYDLYLAGWSADTPEPHAFYRALLHSESIRGDTRPPDDKYAALKKDSDPLFAVWGIRL